MIKRLIAGSLAASIVGAAVLVFWRVTLDFERQQATEIVAGEARGTRQQLGNRIEIQMRALRDLAIYWAEYDDQPVDQWVSDARIELDHFHGMEMVAWSSRTANVRYFAETPIGRLDQNPTERQWQQVKEVFAHVEEIEEAMIEGPLEGKDGNAEYRVVIPAGRDGDEGVLFSVVDAQDSLHEMLVDESPSYHIMVRWDGTELYRRGEPAQDLPAEWIQRETVALLMGPKWEVTQVPTEDMVSALESPASSALLIVGLGIAAVMGLLVFETLRSRERHRVGMAAEQELQELNRHLEETVRERVRDLEEVSADLRTISEAASHDLRAPLAAIVFELALLREWMGESDPADAREAVERIDLAVDRMSRIIENLLRLSQVSHATFEPEEVDLNILASEVFEELNDAERGPEAEVEIEHLPTVTGDADLLRILFTNLIENALKFGREGVRREIEIGSEVLDEGPQIFVRDNGVGFESEMAEKIFRPFERLSAADPNGVGLGLAIAARVVRRHGGRIWAEAAPEQGATFVFSLGESHPTGATDDAV